MNAKPFSQAVQWPATIVEQAQKAEFEAFIAEEFGCRAQYLFNAVTAPDCGDPTTGGRNDAYFTVHEDDIGKFAVPRFKLGMRWVDDVLANERSGQTIYTKEVHALKSWD